MVRVVEEQAIVVVTRVMLADALHQFVLVPFMDDDEIGIPKYFI